MKNILSSVLGCLAAPFNAGREFVDTRPSFSSVREHLGQTNTMVSLSEDKTRFDVSLVFPSAPELAPVPILEVDAKDSIQNAEVYAKGVSEGYGLAMKKVQSLRRSTIAAQNAVLRAEEKRLACLRKSAAEVEEADAAAAGMAAPILT